MPDRPLPAVLRAAVALVALEGLGLLGLTVWVALGPVLYDDITSVAGVELLAAFALVGAVAFGLLARGLANARRWARGPVVLLELLAVPVGVGLLQGGLVAAGVVVLLLAAAVLLTLFAPAARRPFEPSG